MKKPQKIQSTNGEKEMNPLPSSKASTPAYKTAANELTLRKKISMDVQKLFMRFTSSKQLIAFKTQKTGSLERQASVVALDHEAVFHIRNMKFHSVSAFKLECHVITGSGVRMMMLSVMMPSDMRPL